MMSGKSSVSTSPASSNSSPGKIEIYVGNRIEAMDYMSNWYVSKIAKVDYKKKKILIHFEGWNQRYDEWVSFDSKKIRPLPKEKEKTKSKAKECKQEWKEGNIVSAKWSDGTYYPAEIVKVISKEFYEVEYDDGFQKIIHHSKIRDQDTANKQKKRSGSSSQPQYKAKLAQDRASRAQRRSDKDRSMLTLSSSELPEQMDEKNEAKNVEMRTEHNTGQSVKRQRCDSETTQQSKRPKIEQKSSKEKSGGLELSLSPTKEATSLTTKDSVSAETSNTKAHKTHESQPEQTSKPAEKSSEKLKGSIADDTLSTNAIRVTHIKEKAKGDSSNSDHSKHGVKSPVNVEQSVKRSVTSPLSVEVERRTDIQQVIVPDNDMKILQSTGVLGLLNVQEPCVILGTTLAGTSTSTSAAEEVLSKCKVPAKITTEVVEPLKSKPAQAKASEDSVKQDLGAGEVFKVKKLDEMLKSEKGDICRTKLDPKRDVPKGASLDNKCVPRDIKDTAKDVAGVEQDGGSQEVRQVTESGEGIYRGTRSPVDKSELVQKSSQKQMKENSMKSSNKPDEITENVDPKERNEQEDPTELTEKTEETKPKPEVDTFKAKRLRLDQITGKLSMQRQTEITAKREVIKQKIDHLKSEEITKSSHMAQSIPHTYQQISPNPPPYHPTPCITPQYVERYPAPTILTYPTQCTGLCCAYSPGNSYPPASSGGYHISPGGLPHDAYMVYGPGSQASFPVISPTVAHPQCGCGSLYSGAVLHDSGHSGPPLMRLMQVDQRSRSLPCTMSTLPASVVYTQTTSHQGERAKISPRGVSPRGTSSKGISPEGRKRVKKTDNETKHKDKSSIDEKQGIRLEESLNKKAKQTSSKLPSKDPVTGRLLHLDKLPDATTCTPNIPHPKSAHSTPSHPQATPNAPAVDLSKHICAHITSPQEGTPSKRPSHLSLDDPDDLPLSRLVNTSGESTPEIKTSGVKKTAVKTPVSTPGDGSTSLGEQLMSTPLPADGFPGKLPPRRHVFAPKELRIELDHNKFKCEHPDCDKSFRKASLLDAHVKYYHNSPPMDHKRKRSSASGSEEDSFEHPKRRTKRQSTSDVSIGSVGDNSVDPQSPTASDIHVEVEQDLDDEMDVDVSEQKEEDVVRCLCGVHEDSGLMIQCEQCYTWQHSDCVIDGKEHVPTKYFCYVCKNPPGLRKNARYKNNYDWFKTGVLPAFVPCDNDEVKIVQAQSTHYLLSDIHILNNKMKGVSRKIHILKSPNHSDLRMWEHKHEVCEDDSITTEGGKNDFNVSGAGVNDISIKDKKLAEGIPQDNVFKKKGGECENHTPDENIPSEEIQARGEGESKVAKSSEDGKIIEYRNNIGQQDKLSKGEKINQESKQATAKAAIGPVQKNNEQTHQESGELKMKETSRSSDDKARNENESARNKKETASSHSNQARDSAESARMNDTEAREGKEVVGLSNHIRTDYGNKMIYSGKDLAFVNLLEEIEEDQSFFDEQLDRLEKQVEILEKSFKSGTSERKPSIRKLARQLSKLQKLGFVF